MENPLEFVESLGIEYEDGEISPMYAILNHEPKRFGGFYIYIRRDFPFLLKIWCLMHELTHLVIWWMTGHSNIPYMQQKIHRRFDLLDVGLFDAIGLGQWVDRKYGGDIE